jgi:hypothetical protein
MPVDIAKAYFEIQQLRREVRKAERALKDSFARSANRARLPGRKPRDARSASLTSLGRRRHQTRSDLIDKITTDQPDDVAGLKGKGQ